jgi:hypothetical protein
MCSKRPDKITIFIAGIHPCVILQHIANISHGSPQNVSFFLSFLIECMHWFLIRLKTYLILPVLIYINYTCISIIIISPERQYIINPRESLTLACGVNEEMSHDAGNRKFHLF